MASKINADEFVDREGEGKPTLPKGVVLSGVTTITTAVVAENEVANSTGINVGIITSTHFAGNLTGDVNAGIVTVTSQTVIGSAVTISASGIDIGAGVITATSYAGSGANLTGIGATIMVWEYNPDPSDMAVPFATGIGITFNQKIKAGSGNITLRETNSSGTVVENFGIGSSVTIAGNSLTIDPTSDLSEEQLYHLSYPSGVITNMAGENYVGTAYTFKALAYTRNLYTWGRNLQGELGHNAQGNAPTYPNSKSSPTQVPGTIWKNICMAGNGVIAAKSDGTLWAWGQQRTGEMGINQASSPTGAKWSSPVQIGSDTTWSTTNRTIAASFNLPTGLAGAVKTDGTLWTWGDPEYGALGLNGPTTPAGVSSPTQVGSGTDWSKISMSGHHGGAVKTDGTLWVWGKNHRGCLGQNQGGNNTGYSSPVQIPGTDWSDVNLISSTNYCTMFASKTNGTLWSWGYNEGGQSGQNNRTNYSSPVQIPGTTWSLAGLENNGWFRANGPIGAIKTDGAFWVWGDNDQGALGQNQEAGKRSSPVQIPGTWSKFTSFGANMAGVKTDGTLWAWGANAVGQLGQNTSSGPTKVSSPIQIGSETDWSRVSGGENSLSGIRRT